MVPRVPVARKARLYPRRMGTKTCRVCGEEKPFGEFNLDRAKKDGRTSRCRPCNRLICSKWVSDNPERKRQSDRRWAAANVDRRMAVRRRWRHANPEEFRARARLQQARRHARKVSGAIPYTLDQLMDRMRYWGLRCWMCGGSFEQIDHVKPLAVGGLDALCNVRPACERCNRKKAATWPWLTAVR